MIKTDPVTMVTIETLDDDFQWVEEAEVTGYDAKGRPVLSNHTARVVRVPTQEA